MLTSMGLLFLCGLAMAWLARQLRLPRIIGMLMTGILLGPCVLNVLDPSILGISAELRRMALVIILIKAGLSLDLKDLKKVGRPALLLSFLPACCEILGTVLLAPALLHISVPEACLLGSVLAAVSPAVVVPRMVQLMEEGYGTDKSIPQMILAGASLDDVFVIVLFSSCTSLVQNGSASASALLDIPASIVLGILLGIAAGFLLHGLFENAHRRGHSIRSSNKVLILLGTAFLLLAAENALKGILAVSGLLAVTAMACTVGMRCIPPVTKGLSGKFGKLWLGAEVLLFTLVGAAVDIRYTLTAGPAAVALILLALVFRSVGTFLCTVGTALNRRERLYCVLAYLPKATVQAAIGSVPLGLGLACGSLVLSAAVLAILITAPLGALAMDATYRKLLKHTPENPIAG